MHEQERGRMEAQGQPTQICRGGRGQSSGGPLAYSRRIFAESTQIDTTRHTKVVIPCHAERPETTKPGDTLFRFGTIADQIAKHPDMVEPSSLTCVSNHRLKGSKIGVNVRQNQYPGHRWHYTMPQTQL